MITIRQLMDKIEWDNREDPYDYTFYYYDRIEKKLLAFAWSEIVKKDGLFVEVKIGEIISPIPLHRIKEVLKKGKLVWSRKYVQKN